MTTTATYRSLDPRWLKAAYLGSLWASIEIVLGSFLHNVKFPLTGTILSAIGISLLVAGHSLWKEQGIVWRAGIICAFMKSVSPSAVILGPMIGITLEALIVEAAIRLSSGAAAGYLIGGAAACTTPLLQKMVSYLFTYGTNIAVVFEKLVEFAAKNLRMPWLTADDVIWAFIIANILLGGGAAWCGMMIGKRARKTERGQFHAASSDTAILDDAGVSGNNYSLLLLSIHTAAVIAGLTTQSPYVLLLLPFWYQRYHQVRKQFQKPAFWVEIGAVSISAGIILGEFVLFDAGAGAVLGIEMFLRALFVVTAFGAISAELRNPRIINAMRESRFRNFSVALDAAFTALPAITDRIQREHSFFRRPIDALAAVFADTDELLQRHSSQCTVHILTGEQGSGKSSSLRSLAIELQKRSIQTGGFVQLSVWNNGQRIGYDLADLKSGLSAPLCRTDAPDEGISAGPYFFSRSTIESGIRSLETGTVAHDRLVIIDEIGPLELEEKGWAAPLRNLLQNYNGTLLLSIRPALVNEVLEHFAIAPLSVRNASSSTAFQDIIEQLQQPRREQ